MKRKNVILAAAGAVALLIATAGAGAVIYSNQAADNAGARQQGQQQERINWSDRVEAQPVQQQPACDDDNIVGKVAGGVAGGVAGSQIGKGNGQTAATIGGAVGGSLLGEEYLPTRNVTCRR